MQAPERFNGETTIIGGPEEDSEMNCLGNFRVKTDAGHVKKEVKLDE